MYLVSSVGFSSACGGDTGAVSVYRGVEYGGEGCGM